VGLVRRRVGEPAGRWLDRHDDRIPLLQLLPGLFWVIGILGGALVIVLTYSFLETAPIQGALTPTLANYREFLSTPYYLAVFAESFLVAVAVTVLSLAVAYPAAYYIAFAGGRRRTLLLLLLVLPFWINLVVRTFAWQLILGEGGLIDYLARDLLGLVDEPVSFLFSRGAVVLGLVHVFMPFAVIPLYTSLDRIDPAHLEAARNLGANRLQAFYEVTLPQSVPGLAASGAIVFVLSFGSFLIPDMLGGQGNLLIGNVIARLFGESFDWALGSAAAVVFVVTALGLVYAFNRVVGLGSLYGGESA
jgi:ABC-type spermidine/putrescine transport system permease subunit I